MDFVQYYQPSYPVASVSETQLDEIPMNSGLRPTDGIRNQRVAGPDQNALNAPRKIPLSGEMFRKMCMMSMRPTSNVIFRD